MNIIFPNEIKLSDITPEIDSIKMNFNFILVCVNKDTLEFKPVVKQKEQIPRSISRER